MNIIEHRMPKSWKGVDRLPETTSRIKESLQKWCGRLNKTAGERIVLVSERRGTYGLVKAYTRGLNDGGQHCFITHEYGCD